MLLRELINRQDTVTKRSNLLYDSGLECLLPFASQSIGMTKDMARQLDGTSEIHVSKRWDENALLISSIHELLLVALINWVQGGVLSLNLSLKGVINSIYIDFSCSIP